MLSSWSNESILELLDIMFESIFELVPRLVAENFLPGKYQRGCA